MKIKEFFLSIVLLFLYKYLITLSRQKNLVNKTIGIGIGIAVIAIAAALAYSYSIPESETQVENITIEEEATVNVQTEVTETGKEISIEAKDSLGLEDIPGSEDRP